MPLNPETYAKEGNEHSHQVAVMIWASQNLHRFPELELLHAIPNGGQRGDGSEKGRKIAGGRLKAEGVKEGVSDLFLPVARHNCHGLYIEMKHETGKASKDQLDWISKVQGQGYGGMIAHGWKAAIEALEQYLS